MMNHHLPHKEITFMVSKDPDLGFIATSFSISCQAESIKELKKNLIEAIETHFEEDLPNQITLKFETNQIVFRV